jgi:ABC-type lipoprotein export system ATPase subunit
VHVADVIKEYQALRPLRLKALRLRPGEAVALRGLDKTAAEVLVNMLTGSSLPDAGVVRVFGRQTTDIADSAEWLALLRRFALLSERTVLVEQLTVEQNMAIPHTLTLDPMPVEVRRQVRAMAVELGLSEGLMASRAEGLSPFDLSRVRLGRALALGADVLLAEHPTAPLDAADREPFARIVAGAVTKRRMAALYLTADDVFAKCVGAEVLTLKPATGELTSPSGWLRWFAGGGGRT